MPEPKAQPESSFEQRILQEQLKVLYQGIPPVIIGMLAVSLLMVYALWDKADSREMMLVWLVVVLVFLAWRTYDNWRYHKAESLDVTPVQWARHLYFGAIFSGLLWGGTAWMMFPSQHPEYQVFMVVVIVGVTASTLATYSNMQRAIVGFILTSQTLLVLKLLLVASALTGVLLLFLVIYIAFMSNAARRIHASSVQNIRLRLEALGREKAVHQMQQKQKFHLQQTFLAVVEWDINLHVTEWNKSAERMFGYSRDEALGRNLLDLIVLDQDRQQIVNFWTQMIASGDRTERELVNRNAAGDQLDCIWFATPLMDQHGLVFGGAATAVDISDRKRAELHLIQTKDEAERANRAKSEFLSSMSHELRTPLNTILGFSELLIDDCADTDQVENAQLIHKAGAHLLNLINDLLDLEKIEAGKLTVMPVAVHAGELLQDCESLVGPLASSREIKLNIENTDCQRMVMADFTRLKQCLLNLISNAIKYNRQAGEVRVYCQNQEDKTLRISVTDSGPGIEPAMQARLFEPFDRLGHEGSSIEGTGIGLVITKKLIEMMQGRLGVDSSPGQGSTFWIELPLTAENQPAGIKQTQKKEARMQQDDGKTILYIEDNPDNTRLVTHILNRNSDYQLLNAPTPTLGIELANAHHPDLIMLDINLPEMDGYEVLKRLQAGPDTRDIPVIAVSANAMPEDFDRAREAGFSDYVTKPLQINGLLETLKGFLG